MHSTEHLPYQSKHPSLPNEVWLEIFQFATYTRESVTISPIDPFIPVRVSNSVYGPNKPSFSLYTKTMLVLVCRHWRRLASQLLYQHIVICSLTQARAVFGSLKARSCPTDNGTRMSEYGQYTHHLEISTSAPCSCTSRFQQVLWRIFICCPNLRMLSGAWQFPLDYDFVSSTAKLYGGLLKGLAWCGTLTSPSFFSDFYALRVLDIHCVTFQDQEPSIKSLPKLEELLVNACSHSMDTFISVSMPNLKTLTIRVQDSTEHTPIITRFLAAHGASLHSVHIVCAKLHDIVIEDESMPMYAKTKALWAYCPHLDTFTFPVSDPPFTTGHPSLRRVGLRNLKSDDLNPENSNIVTDRLMLLSDVNLFPRLETVRTIDLLVDRHLLDMAVDYFVWWEESFERRGVDFQDGGTVQEKNAFVQMTLPHILEGFKAKLTR